MGPHLIPLLWFSVGEGGWSAPSTGERCMLKALKKTRLVHGETEDDTSFAWPLFRLQNFSTSGTVALSFVFDNYCPIVD
jgi:hypothetical protein